MVMKTLRRDYDLNAVVENNSYYYSFFIVSIFLSISIFCNFIFTTFQRQILYPITFI